MQIMINGEERYYTGKSAYMKKKLIADMNETGLQLGMACSKRTRLFVKKVSVTEYEKNEEFAYPHGDYELPLLGVDKTIKSDFESCISQLSNELQNKIIEVDKYLLSHKALDDDTEYILQGAFSSISFDYSWARYMCEKDCLAIYGLTCEVHDKKNYSEEEFIRIALGNILKGYPVVIEPKEYTDTILATGFSHSGKNLNGLAFLDGDDDKNAVMSFKHLQSFSGWYRDDVNFAQCPK